MTPSNEHAVIREAIRLCLAERDVAKLERFVNLVLRNSATITAEDVCNMLNDEVETMPEPVYRWWLLTGFGDERWRYN